MQLYAERNDMQAFVERHGYNDKWDQLSEDEQNRLLVKATILIEAYHGKPRDIDSDVPWGVEFFRQAAIYQTLYLMRVGGNDEIGLKVRAVTNGNYSDGVLSTGPANDLPLDRLVQRIIDNILQTVAPVGAMEFARG